MRRALNPAAALVLLAGLASWFQHPSSRLDRPSGQPLLLEPHTYRIALGTASRAELQLLPGLGPARARRLHRHLAATPVSDPWQLTAVPGIGPRTVERLIPYIRQPKPLAPEAASR